MKAKKTSLAVGALLVAMSPVMASAATDSENTTINAQVQSVISVSTSTTVNLNVTPTATGSLTSASDTVSVSTNNSAGYTLTLADGDANTNLVNGGETITAHAGTQAVPTALATNTWGYAVAGLGGFDASYATETNADGTVSATKWAGMPASGSATQLKQTAATASGDTTTVWYAVEADSSKPNGTYTDSVVYTATTR